MFGPVNIVGHVWENYEQKETTYFNGAYIQVTPLK